MPHANVAVAQALAAAFAVEGLDVEGCVRRGARLLGRRWRWLRPLAQRAGDAFSNHARPRQIEVVNFLLRDEGFRRASEKHELTIVTQVAAPPAMSPAAAGASWDVPAIRTSTELADWLEIALGELDWFADLRALEYKRNQGRLRHYHYRILAKRFGQVRLIEAPKNRLKAIQRRILTDILERISPHASAHGFRRGRSAKTFAEAHTGKQVVLKIDLHDFFPSIKAARIQALFRTAGYPERVADLLAGLCTNTAPQDVWDSAAWDSFENPVPAQIRRARWLYSQPHLPQGAPTSPALANLAAYRMDCRLAALASSCGAIYTRYADDLAFSGGHDFARVVRRFHLHVSAIVMEEGFAVHHRKTRIMRQGVCQRLAGIVVNQHTNVMRADYDRLKATLTNCLRHGIHDQNRTACDDFRAHLLGKIAYVEMIHPHRGSRLRELFDQIAW
jgi:RNA-directed DNA polymerase